MKTSELVQFKEKFVAIHPSEGGLRAGQSVEVLEELLNFRAASEVSSCLVDSMALEYARRISGESNFSTEEPARSRNLAHLQCMLIEMIRRTRP